MILYLTADDAGASIEVNERIEAATRDGYVNSVSVLTNTQGFDDAVARFAGRTDLRLSLHLNLVEGVPLALDNTSPLVAANGNFRFQAAGLLLHYLVSSRPARRRIQEDMRTEWTAQILKFSEQFGLVSSLNIDSHQHVHVFPFAVEPLSIALRAAGMKAKSVRLPDESPLPRMSRHTLRHGYLTLNLVKSVFLRRQSRNAKRRLLENHQDVMAESSITGHMENRFCGVLCTTRMTWDACDRFLRTVALNGDKNQYAEVLLHPGGGKSCTEAWLAAPPLQSFYTSHWREVEFQTACDPRWGAQSGWPHHGL